MTEFKVGDIVGATNKFKVGDKVKNVNKDSFFYSKTGVIFDISLRKKAAVYYVEWGSGINSFVGCGDYTDDELEEVEKKMSKFKVGEKVKPIERSEEEVAIITEIKISPISFDIYGVIYVKDNTYEEFWEEELELVEEDK